MTKYALVGDVGGTNARLALCDVSSGEISRAKTYSGLDYPSLEAVVRVYLEEHQVSVEDGCIAIACPITGDWVAMTNHTWAFSIAEMKKNLGFSHLEIINDFTAVSMAIPMLKPEHLIQFGGAEPVEGKPIAVYGAGTGLGVSHLVHVAQRWVSLPGEGGHVDFAPNSEEEGIILEELRAEIGHVSAERVLSHFMVHAVRARLGDEIADVTAQDQRGIHHRPQGEVRLVLRLRQVAVADLKHVGVVVGARLLVRPEGDRFFVVAYDGIPVCGNITGGPPGVGKFARPGPGAGSAVLTDVIRCVGNAEARFSEDALLSSGLR